MTAISNHRCVLICQNRTCRKQGSASVLAAFTRLSIPGVEVIGSGCLGKCGNGPMVLVLPNTVWYSGVLPGDVSMIVEQYLLENKE